VRSRNWAFLLRSDYGSENPARGTGNGYVDPVTKTIAILLALAACTETPATDAEIHEPLECESNWASKPVVTCEAPCASFGDLGTSSTCSYGAGETCAAGYYKTFGGRRGCCVIEGDVVEFNECD